MSYYHYRRIPYGNFQIGKGISMAWLGNHISVNARLEVSGANATSELATRIKQTIEFGWNVIFEDGYMMTCNVDMRFRDKGLEDPSRNQIYVINKNETTATFAFPLYNSFINYYLNADTRVEWTPAHEFGHMLGFRDQYMEDYSRIVRRTNNIERATTVERGWEGNIMSVFWGIVEKKNLQALLAMYATEMTILKNNNDEDFWSRLGRSRMGSDTFILQSANL